MAGLGSATCESCKAGHFAATVGSSECDLCRAGSYAAAGSHECSRCPPGTYSSIAATNCTPCQEGWVAEGWGSPTCKPCLAGTYAHEGRLCRQCPGNTISTLGCSKCEPCVGSFLLAYADAERVTCHASMTSLFFGLMTAVCLIMALMLSAWLCFYQLHIEDLSLQATACHGMFFLLLWFGVMSSRRLQKCLKGVPFHIDLSWFIINIHEPWYKSSIMVYHPIFSIYHPGFKLWFIISSSTRTMVLWWPPAGLIAFCGELQQSAWKTPAVNLWRGSSNKGRIGLGDSQARKAQGWLWKPVKTWNISVGLVGFVVQWLC